jgi:acyl carrier protein
MTDEGLRAEIRDRLNRVFQEVFDDDTIEVFNEMTANDIEEWDSLMHISLIVSAEEEFDVRLSSAEIGDLKDVGQMIDLIEKHVG